MGGRCRTCGTELKILKLKSEKPDGKIHFGEVGVDGRIIYKLVLIK